MNGKEHIIIVGGGLCGLALAYYLQQSHQNIILLEGSSRLGGRIYTVKGKLETPLELGATWFSDYHTNLIELLDELQLKKYTQRTSGISLFEVEEQKPPQRFTIPEHEQPSYRIAGGTQQIINALVSKLNGLDIYLNTKIVEITEVENTLKLKSTTGKEYFADKVVLCMPPELIGAEIAFHPKLPKQLEQIFPTVHTWMAGSIKFVIEYDEPFWRNSGYSGLFYSHVGLITEMYDHTNIENDKYGFTGFLNQNASRLTQEQRQMLVLQQLEKQFGSKVLNPSFYKDNVWTNKFVLGKVQTIYKAHQNNGHPVLKENYYNRKLFFSGTESSSEYSGYMEGAVIAAKETLLRLTKP